MFLMFAELAFCFFLATGKVKKTWKEKTGFLLFLLLLVAPSLFLYEATLSILVTFEVSVYFFMYLATILFLQRKHLTLEQALLRSNFAVLGFGLSFDFSHFVIGHPFIGSVTAGRVYTLLTFLLFCLFSSGSYFLFGKLYVFLEKKQTAQKTALLLSTILVLFALTTSAWSYGGKGNLSLIKITQTLSVFLIVFMVLLLMKMYSTTLEEKHRIETERRTYESAQQYTKEIESRYQEIRKFKHDYKNILLSLETFIAEKDYVELESYFFEKIKKQQTGFLTSDLQLSELSNLRNVAIKSIFATKLFSVENFTLHFEVKEPIEIKTIDTILLVRALGIILDNALEELETLEKGTLSIAVIQKQGDVFFIIKNTCRKELPPLYQLKTEGFSTKGKNRGLGLSNLQEIIQPIENIVLETTVKQQEFTQILTIINGGALC